MDHKELARAFSFQFHIEMASFFTIKFNQSGKTLLLKVHPLWKDVRSYTIVPTDHSGSAGIDLKTTELWSGPKSMKSYTWETCEKQRRFILWPFWLSGLLLITAKHNFFQLFFCIIPSLRSGSKLWSVVLGRLGCIYLSRSTFPEVYGMSLERNLHRKTIFPYIRGC